MLNVSTAFKQKLYNDEREYVNTLQFTLADNTTLTVDNEHILGGGLDFEDAVGEDSSFTALGSTVCNGLTAVLYNLDESFSDYVFEGAKCVWYTGLMIVSGDTETPEMIKKGVFTVDSATYNDYTITLTMLDNMEQFDRPYTLSSLAYPATLDAIVRNACSICDVTLDTNSLNFPNKNYSVPVRPEDGSTTFREVLGWCATIAGCFARCNVDGKLELKWFDTDVFDDETGYDGGVFDSSNPYSTGDSVNGGTFNPWNVGDSADGDEFTTNIPFHYITSLNTQSFGVDDIIVTGVRIIVKLDAPDSSSSEQEYFAGTSNYVIEVTDNPFITTTTAQSVLSFLSTQLIGLTFRQCNVTHPNDPTIEAGDVGLIWDTRGDEHHILITRVTFAPDSPQTIVCGAETVSKNQSTRVTSQTKSFIEARKQLRKQRDEYQAAMDDLRDAIENADGLYETDVVQQDSSVIRYLHNKPDLSDSDIQIVISTAGVTMTPDGGDHWYGLQVDGTLIASIMNTIGINFDWGTGGTLTLGGQNNVNGLLQVLNASGTQVGQWGKDGLTAKSLTADEYIYVDGNTSSYFKIPFNSDTSHYLEISSSGLIMKMLSRVSLSGSSPITPVTVTYGTSSGYDRAPIEMAADNYNAYSIITPTKINVYSQGWGNVNITPQALYANSSSYGKSASIYENLTVSGTKSRKAATKDYGDRLLYCYETASPLFGDIGDGVICTDGYCYVNIDPILSQTINTNHYQVFLQAYGTGECFVIERTPTYFVVQGTPGLSFGWELKSRQVDFTQRRLDAEQFLSQDIIEYNDYGGLALDHIQKIHMDREVLK